MTIKVEISGFNEVEEMTWGRAKEICQEVISQGKEDAAMALIEELFAESEPSDTTINDFIWFELADMLGLYEEDEEDAEEEEE